MRRYRPLIITILIFLLSFPLIVDEPVSGQSEDPEEPVVEIIFDRDEYFVDLWEKENVTLVVTGYINITWPEDLEWINFSIHSGGIHFSYFDGDNIDDFPGNVSYNETMIPFSITLNVTDRNQYDMFIGIYAHYEFPRPEGRISRKSMDSFVDITRIEHGVLNIEMWNDEATARPGSWAEFRFHLIVEGTIPFNCRLVWLNEELFNGTGIDLEFTHYEISVSRGEYTGFDAIVSNDTEESIYHILVGVEVMNEYGEYELVDQFTREYTLTVKERDQGFESSHVLIVVVLSLLILATIIYIVYTRKKNRME